MTFGAKDESKSNKAGTSGSAVHSVSISRRAATGRGQGATRRAAGRKRTVSRSMRRFESALAQLEVVERLSSPGNLARLAAGSGWHASKLLSGLLVAAAIAALGLIHTNDEWFVYAEDVQFTNVSYLDRAELYKQSGVEGWNLLWLTDNEVRQRILEHPYVADAAVSLRLPAQVTVNVVEKHPIALWVTKDETLWLTPEGRALPAAGPTDPSLPQIIDILGEAQAIGSEGERAIDPAVLDSALALMAQMPSLHNKVRYNQDIGLNFPMPDHNVWVYWGDGENVERKLENLAAARTALAKLEEPPQLVDVRFVHSPYFR